MSSPAVLTLQHLSKKVGNYHALHRFSCVLRAGEVVGLAERGGLGKNALLRILSGKTAPERGEIWHNGRKLQWPFPTVSSGIRIVYETPALADSLNITNNIFLGQEIHRGGLLKWFNIPHQQEMDKQAVQLLAWFGLSFPSLHASVGNLTEEQRQLIMLAQAKVSQASIIIIEDPSASLSLPFQEKLLELIRFWQGQQTAVLFISRNVDHLFAVSDRIIVLREGRMVASQPTDETTKEAVVTAMVGTGERQQRTPIIWALDSFHSARQQAETLRHNQSLLQRNLSEQDSLNRDLLNQLAKQVKALDSANLALQDAQRRLLTEREQERKHLSRELHDQIIQDLLSLNFQLEELEEKTAALPSISVEISDARFHIRNMVEDLRRICGSLRPPTIDSLGLNAALQSLISSWEERTNIATTLQLDVEDGRLPEAIELSIFRIVQESLNNVSKHAQASHVTVSLSHTSPRLLLITIADNGRGLPPDFDLATLSHSGHYGLLGISERVALLGGRLSLQNQASSGLLLRAEVPHPRIIPETG